ncbi:hypothetical protein AAC387_Pa05g2619 [Persea americana]
MNGDHGLLMVKLLGTQGHRKTTGRLQLQRERDIQLQSTNPSNALLCFRDGLLTNLYESLP